MPVKSQTSRTYFKERPKIQKPVSGHDVTVSSVEVKHDNAGIPSVCTLTNIAYLHFTVKMRVADFYGQQLHRFIIHHTRVTTATVT